MSKLFYLFSFLYLVFQSSLCFSKESFNVTLIPDLFNCHHHFGLEFAISENNTLGIIGTDKCTSDRPTYGDSNNKVDNTFNRIFIPWRYSFNGVFRDGYFIQTMIGMEKSRFKSEAGSRADVTFHDLTFHGGYQWFWDSGINVSALAGVAILKRSSLTKNIVPDETDDVVKFLDKNTKSNEHIGVGVIFGWAF